MVCSHNPSRGDLEEIQRRWRHRHDQDNQNLGWLLDREYRERRIREYLDGLHASMWGRGFDLSQEESREQAVAFLVDAVEAVLQ